MLRLERCIKFWKRSSHAIARALQARLKRRCACTLHVRGHLRTGGFDTVAGGGDLLREALEALGVLPELRAIGTHFCRSGPGRDEQYARSREHKGKAIESLHAGRCSLPQGKRPGPIVGPPRQALDIPSAKATGSMVFDQADLDRSFDPQTLQRARLYVAEHRVADLRFSDDGNVARASVQGSGIRPYAVRLSIAERAVAKMIESDCSCPVGGQCKHGAAVAISMLEGRSAQHAGATDGAVDAWMRQILDRFGKEPEEQAERIVYAVDVGESYGMRRFRLQPYVVGRKPREYMWQNFAASRGHFMTGLDRVAGKLASASGLLGFGADLSPEIIAILLDLLANANVLHWQDPLSPALERLAIDDATLRWEADEHDLVRVQLEDHPGAILLPTAPLWYLDPISHLIGPVALDVPADIAALIARAPALDTAQAERVQISLNRILRRANVLGPAPELAQKIDTLAPVPVLRLDMIDGLRPGGELFFAYGDQLIAANNTTVTLRDREFERYARERLQRLDFPPFGESEWLQFLERDAPLLQQDGWRIETTPAFPFRIVAAGDEWSAEVYENGAAQWFELELGVDVDGSRISLLPVLIDALSRSGFDLDSDPAALARRERPFVGKLPGGGYVALPVERVARVLATLGGLFGDRRTSSKERVRVPVLQAPSLAAAGGIAMRWNHAPSIRALIDDLGSAMHNEVTLPPQFVGELRGYQRECVAWLQTLRTHRAGGVLADDMGLGKTVEVLAHIAVERAHGRLTKPVLVVSPTSVSPNWRNEIARFLPDAKILSLTGFDRFERFERIGDATIVLTTYALLVRDAQALAAHEWSIAILDEAQAIKNPRSKAALAALNLQADQRLALTGTPIENHLEELWSIFAYAVPGVLPDRSRFARLFRTPIEKHDNRDRRTALAARIKPFFMRRTKEAVAQDLPEKSEIVQRVPLSGRQRDLYETIRLTMHRRVRDEVEKRGLARSRIIVLDALLKLRQVCCDPRLLKLDAADGIEESQKLEALLEMLESLIDDGRRILLFSQFTTMLDLIKPELAKRSMPFVELRGDTRDRETPVNRFQAREVPLFLISLKAGGTGLNLTAADTVIHYDPWWNPAVERQATDRAHRIGQDQHVFVYKLIAGEYRRRAHARTPRSQSRPRRQPLRRIQLNRAHVRFGGARPAL